MRVTVHAGETLWEAVQRVAPGQNRPCGGNGTCGGCKVQIKGIGEVPSCQFRQEGIYDVILSQKETQFSVVLPTETVKLTEGNVAIDIGTTTIAIAKGTKSDVQYTTAINPQRQYGADVLSRIKAAGEGKLATLTRLVNDDLAAELENAKRVWITGNTTMLHLFRGDDCTSLGVAPFTPKVLAPITEGKVTTLPVVSAFVGADVVCGIYETRLHRRDGVNLLVDLGTNGELALGVRGKVFVSATAAGPAFEGSRFTLTIKGANVIGVLAKLRAEGKIDEYGTLSEPYFTEGGIWQEGGFLTQEEIRDLQMAKAAVRAGVEILLKEAGISPEGVENVFLAGGMGKFLREEDALAIGLFPKAWEGKIRSVGNLALQGAMRAMESDALAELETIAKEATPVALAGHLEFEERYISYMNF